MNKWPATLIFFLLLQYFHYFKGACAYAQKQGPLVEVRILQLEEEIKKESAALKNLRKKYAAVLQEKERLSGEIEQKNKKRAEKEQRALKPPKEKRQEESLGRKREEHFPSGKNRRRS